MKDEAIEMTDDWAQQINDISFMSRQKGRMTHLLKKKSKVVKKQKPRKTYEPFDFVKKFRGEDGKVIQVPMPQIDTYSKSNEPPPKKIIP